MTSSPSICSVERKCSSTGKACAVDDRACQSDAIGRSLEITCERSDPPTYVYCPPGGEQRDSNVVWILLVVAVAIAAVGGVLSYFVFRKRLTR
jgi:hypothetical protein